MSDDTFTIDGQIYSAGNLAGSMWMVKWFKGEHDQYVEAEIWSPDGVTWTAKDAIEAAIKRESWA